MQLASVFAWTDTCKGFKAVIEAAHALKTTLVSYLKYFLASIVKKLSSLLNSVKRNEVGKRHFKKGVEKPRGIVVVVI